MVYYTTQENRDHLKRVDFNIRSKQVHEQVTKTKSDIELADKLLTHLVAKDVLFDGRTNAIFKNYKPATDKKIYQYDFASTYPFISKITYYPLGHHGVIFENFDTLKAYFALLRSI